MPERGWRKGTPPTLLQGMQSGNSRMEDSMEVPGTTEQRATAWSSSETVGLCAETNPKDTRTPGFTAARFTVAKMRKQPKWASSDTRIKVSHKHTHTQTHTMQYCSAIKNAFSSQMDGLEMIILSEGRQRTTKSLGYRLWVESKNQCKWTHFHSKNRVKYLGNKIMITKNKRWSGRHKLEGWS